MEIHKYGPPDWVTDRKLPDVGVWIHLKDRRGVNFGIRRRPDAVPGEEGFAGFEENEIISQKKDISPKPVLHNIPANLIVFEKQGLSGTLVIIDTYNS